MAMKLISACLFVIFISACSTPKMIKVSDTLAIKDYVPPPFERKPAEAEAEKQGELLTSGSKEKISLAVRDTDIIDVLFLLSKDSDLPIVADKDVKGKVTVNIKNRDIFEILDAVVKPLGYTVFVEDGVIRVTSPRLISRSFHVNYMRGSRNSSSTMNASISAQSSGQHGEPAVPAQAASGSSTAGVRITTEDK
ncbi:MAG: hypothetical protein ACYC69_16635 [Thermodesulfovibrionales bacterium]